jgi:hypothetical protein
MMRARALFALATAAAAGTALAGGAHADDDPMAYAEIATGRPTGIKCPDARPCVVDKDGAFFVTAKSWKRYYILDHTAATSALLADAEGDDEVDRRVDAAVRAILAFHRAKKAAVDCTAAGAVPALVGSKTGEVSVAVPKVKAAPAPTALTPAEADAAWLAARAALDDLGGSADSESMTTVFAGVDTRAMTGSTFKRPHLRWMRSTLNHRVCKGADCTVDEIVDVNVLVVYSPESEKVYVLDRSVTLPETEHTRERAVRAFADQDVLFATLRALGVSSIVVDPGSLCAVPRVAGKNGWFDLK